MQNGQRSVLLKSTMPPDFIYIIKQDICIYIYVAYSRPNGGTEWAKIVCGHSWVAGDVLGFFPRAASVSI